MPAAPSTFVLATIAGFFATVRSAIDPDPTLGGVIPGNGVAVADGELRAGQPDHAYVSVEGWLVTMRDPSTFGAPDFFTIEEQFDLTGTVWAFEGSDDQLSSRTQALTIFAAVESAVRQEPTLGGAVRVCWFNHHEGKQGVPGDRGNATEITWSLHCEGRVQ